LYYEATDEQPLAGISYYRLKTEDLDKGVTYSDIKLIEREKKDLFVIFYPNPSTGVLNLASSYKSSQITYEITDITGKVLEVTSEIKSEDKIVIDLSSLEKGVYFISAKTPDGKKFSGNKIILR
jgi:hypothetical protein